MLVHGYDAQSRLSTLTSLLGYDGSSTPIPDTYGGVLTFTYDGSLPLSESWSGGAALGKVTRVYDSSFRIKDQKLKPCASGGSCAEIELVSGSDDFVYDVDGLLKQVGALTLARDSDTGQLTGTELVDVTTTQTYNGFGEPKLFNAYDPAAALLYREQVTSRDGMGRILGRTEIIGGVTTTYTYEYFAMGRLKKVLVNSVCATEYTYDANGNRLSTACGSSTPIAAYDAQDRLLDYGSTDYTYSLSGRLESKTNGSAVTSYVYDGFGNLLTVLLPDDTQIDYAVDARGRRIGKSVDTVPVQSWLYQDGLRPVAELDDAGNLKSRFVYASSRNVPDYMIAYNTSTGAEVAKYRFVTDHVGSVRLVVNASTGTVAQRLDYDTWGVVTSDSNPGFQPFGFAGGLYDADTGLVRFGARDYDAEIGRWTSKDPILFRGGDSNIYAYVGNDPVNRVDPSGLKLQTCDIDSYNAVQNLLKDPFLGPMIRQLDDDPISIFIYPDDPTAYRLGGSSGILHPGDALFVSYNMDRANQIEPGVSLQQLVAHELGHIWNVAFNNQTWPDESVPMSFEYNAR